MEKKYFDLKKRNTIALALLCLAGVSPQSAYGMEDKNEGRNPIKISLNYYVNKNLKKLPIIIEEKEISEPKERNFLIKDNQHQTSSQIKMSKYVEMKCHDSGVTKEQWKTFVSTYLYKDKKFLGKTMETQSLNRVLLACLQLWGKCEEFPDKENCFKIIKKDPLKLKDPAELKVEMQH